MITSLLGCLSALLAEPAAAGSAPWWDDQWEVRVAVTVEARPGLLPQRPVVLRWSEIVEKLGGVKVTLSSLRLVAGRELVPFQVDHRDPVGHFLPPGNLRLDPQDELVFVAPADRRTELYLYVSRGPRQPMTFPSGVTVRSQRRDQAHQLLSTADLQIGVQGTGLLNLSRSTQANYARGAVASVMWKGDRLNSIWQAWVAFMNGHPFTSDELNRWNMVKLLVDGPVRKVLAVRCADATSKGSDGSGPLRADVTRYFSMVSGVPLYDVHEIVRCAEAPPSWTAEYVDTFFRGWSDRSGHEVLWEGSSGEHRRFAPKGDGDEVAVSTDSVVDRWYAWFDENRRRGLAVFYGSSQDDAGTPRPARYGFRAQWHTWATGNQMSFMYEGLQAPTTLRHRFRVVGLDDASPEQVAQEYRLWEEPAAEFVRIGRIERR